MPAEVTAPPEVATEIAPVVALPGTVTVSELAVAAVTVALMPPPNKTMLLAGVVLKLVPVMVTVVPAAPEVGVNPVIVGATLAGPPVPTVKTPAEIAVPLSLVIVIGPVDAPLGTVATAVVFPLG